MFRAIVAVLTALELDGAMLTAPTPPPARTWGSAPGSPTTPGHMRLVPLQLQAQLCVQQPLLSLFQLLNLLFQLLQLSLSTPPTLLPPLTTTLSLTTLNLLLWEVPTSSTTSSMVDMIQSPLETSDKEMLPARVSHSWMMINVLQFIFSQPPTNQIISGTENALISNKISSAV